MKPDRIEIVIDVSELTLIDAERLFRSIQLDDCAPDVHTPYISTWGRLTVVEDDE